MIELFQNNSDPTLPWLDLHLSEDTMKYLREFINRPTVEENTPIENLPYTKYVNPRHVSKTDATGNLVGNISKSNWIYDNKNNWFYENVMKRCAENLYFTNWSNYYNVHISKTSPHPTFALTELWVNYQKKHEFNPPHIHSGGDGYSFVVFMKIPTHWKEQHTFITSSPGAAFASDFQFILVNGNAGQIATVEFPLSSEDEGRMLFFPAGMMHQVFPFYGTDEERITISGNILISKAVHKDWNADLQEKEKILEKMKQEIGHIKEQTKHEKKPNLE